MPAEQCVRFDDLYRAPPLGFGQAFGSEGCDDDVAPDVRDEVRGYPAPEIVDAVPPVQIEVPRHVVPTHV
jgi:hypothetical protein